MKEKPILFNADMVNAILEGRKTQTRRIIKPQPKLPKNHEKILSEAWEAGFIDVQCPYGKVGDQLWVRETWADVRGMGFDKDLFPLGASYKAGCDADSLEIAKDYEVKWKPSIHMFRWASRIQLEITDIRVERLKDISEDEVLKEGLKSKAGFDNKTLFARLCESIYGEGSWSHNPWVWVVEFNKI